MNIRVRELNFTVFEKQTLVDIISQRRFIRMIKNLKI